MYADSDISYYVGGAIRVGWGYFHVLGAFQKSGPFLVLHFM